MLRRGLFVLLVMALLLGAVAVVGAQDDEVAATIGVLIPTAEGDFYTGVVEGVEEAAAELGIEVMVVSANADLEEEATQIEALIEAGVDAILFRPVDAVESMSVIAAANEAEIPVFVLGDDLALVAAEVEVASIIGMDNLEGGREAGAYMCESIEGEGDVLELINLPDEEEEVLIATLNERSEGFNEFMAEECAGVTVAALDISEMSAGEVNTTLREAMEEGLAGVVAYSDTDILLAMRASLRVRTASVALVGFNATEDTLGAIQLGRLSGVISPSGRELGTLGIQTAAAFLEGEDIEPIVKAAPLIINPDTLFAVRWGTDCDENTDCSGGP